MATQHTFVVQSNQYTPSSDGSDVPVTITGTVDGQGPITVQVWLSAYSQAYAASGIPGLEALVAPLMYKAFLTAFPPPPQPPVNGVTGTFTYSL